MLFLKNHWRSVLFSTVIVLCLIVGTLTLYGTDKPQEPKIVYVMPERSDNPSNLNTGNVQANPSAKARSEIKTESEQITPTEVPPADEADNLESTDECCPEESNISETEGQPEVVAPEPKPKSKPHITLGEVAESSGMSEYQLSDITDFLPINLSVNIASKDFVEMMDRVEEVIDREMHEIMASVDLDYGREIVQSFKDDPEVTAEGLQLLVDEFLPAHIKDALLKEGVLP